MKIKYILAISFIIVVHFFLLPPSSLASFDTVLNFNNSNIWEISDNNGNVTVDGSYIKLSASSSYTNMFPYLRTREKIFPETELINIKISYRYFGDFGFGSGVALSPSIPHQNKIDISSSITDYVLFNIWQDRADGFVIYSWVCPVYQQICTLPIKIKPDGLQNIDGKYDYLGHEVRFEYSENGKYKIFFDNSSLPSFVSSNGQRRPVGIWIGNSLETHTYDSWSSFEINKISFNSGESFPIIIIPGMGASWDFDAILNGTEGSNWEIPDFIEVYDGLKNSFIGAGYEENKDVYVFSYDWRKPIDTIADSLKTYIDNIYLNSNKKVNLVGHSMGGLVARAYSQKYHDENKVEKVVLMGAPNYGTVKTYGVWEGTEIWDNAWWSKTALSISSHLANQAGETEIQTIRRTIPSIKDMLPTKDYLYLNEAILPWNSMAQKNIYLDVLNDDYLSINNITTNIVSDDDIQTKASINAETASVIDNLLGKWEDGKPKENNGFNYASGDGTVTLESARGPFSNTVNGVGGHIDLVTNVQNIQSILTVLGINPSFAVPGSAESINFENVFMAILKSPGTLEVCNWEMTKCNDQLGIYIQDKKLFLMPGYNNTNLIIKVKENGKGLYALHLGKVTNVSDWVVMNGELKNDNQVDLYTVQSNGSDISAVLDINPPTVPTIIGFKNPLLSCGSFTNVKFNTVDWTDSSDTSGLSGYEYYVDYPLPNGSGRSVWNPSTLWTKSENYGSLNEGIHYIKVRAKDRAGNLSDWSNTCEVTFDSQKPVFADKTIFSGWFNTPQTSYFSYSDVNIKDDYVQPSCQIETEGFNQWCEISPSVCDKAGNCNTDTQISNGVNIDLSSPISSFDLSDLSNNWNGSILGNATDNFSGVAKVELIIKDPTGYQYTVEANGTKSWSYTIPNLTDGKYLISSKATDLAGNIETNLTIKQIELDTIAPKTPKIIFIEGWTQRILAFWLPVKTANRYKVYYQNIKGDFVDMKETTNYFWQSERLSPGQYFVSVSALDKAGNESPKSKAIRVNVNKRWWKW